MGMVSWDIPSHSRPVYMHVRVCRQPSSCQNVEVQNWRYVSPLPHLLHGSRVNLGSWLLNEVRGQTAFQKEVITCKLTTIHEQSALSAPPILQHIPPIANTYPLLQHIPPIATHTPYYRTYGSKSEPWTLFLQHIPLLQNIYL